MTSLIDLTRSPRLGRSLVLYEIDLSTYDLPAYYFTPAEEERGAQVVQMGGVVYSPWPVEFDGIDKALAGTESRPTLKVSNYGRFFSPILNANNNLAGATIRRSRTFERFLDGQSDADPSQVIGPDVYQLGRLTRHDQTAIEWECTSALDIEGSRLPAISMAQDYCHLKYRRWNGSTFDYDTTALACPYTGPQSYDGSGNPVADALDQPSKQLETCCKPRFGARAELPFGGFPALGRFRR